MHRNLTLSRSPEKENSCITVPSQMEIRNLSPVRTVLTVRVNHTHARVPLYANSTIQIRPLSHVSFLLQWEKVKAHCSLTVGVASQQKRFQVSSKNN